MFYVSVEGTLWQPMSREDEGNTKQTQIIVSIVTLIEVDEGSSTFEIVFYVFSCFSSNIMSIFGWYVGSGASKSRTYDMALFNKFQEKEGSVRVELGDDSFYLVKWTCSISFQIPSSDVLGHSDGFFLGLKKNIFSVSCITMLQYKLHLKDYFSLLMIIVYKF